MLRAFGLSLVFMITMWSGARAPTVSRTVVNMRVVRGRIVLYDWLAHETTSGDDFVVKIVGQNADYVRIIYKPNWGFDAPSNAETKRLDRLAFVGRGPVWKFRVHAPETREQIAACSAPIRNHQYKTATGSEPIPRFVSTPGSVIRALPSISSLPCLILNQNGLTPDR